MEKQIKAGAAITNITPKTSCFLHGYPFVERTSVGVHDWLYCSALYLSEGDRQVLFISNDVLYVGKELVANARRAISEKTGIAECNIMIAATHTHSGPVTVDCLVSANDPIVPKADTEYLKFVEEEIVKAACMAYRKAEHAKIAFLHADVTGIGTNRHDLNGSKDMEVPILVLKNMNDEFIASMLVCNMHPTVLHEDSPLVSSDFPHYVRDILQKKYFHCECPVIYFTGAAGNQSPRHVTKSNTFAEAERLGSIVSTAIGDQLSTDMIYSDNVGINIESEFIDLPRKVFPSVEAAEQRRKSAKEKFEHLQKTSDNAQEIRSAEVDWFGMEEIATLSRLAICGDLDATYEKCLPAEIQIFRIGDWNFVAWPGEIFTEYLIELKLQFPNTYMITIANGELQGYIATQEAQQKGYYEASNSFFGHDAGGVMMQETIKLLKKIK